MNTYTKHLTLAFTFFCFLILSQLYFGLFSFGLGWLFSAVFGFGLFYFLEVCPFIVILFHLILNGRCMVISICYGIMFLTQVIFLVTYIFFFDGGMEFTWLLRLFAFGLSCVYAYILSIKQQTNLIKKTYYLPAVFFCLYDILIVFSDLDKFQPLSLLLFLEPLAVFFLFSSLINEEQDAQNQEILVIDIGKHIMWLILSFGTWTVIWAKMVTNSLNIIENTNVRNPSSNTIMFLFVPFYYIFWFYKTAQILDIYCKSKGIDSNLANITLITSIFLPILSPIILQDKINTLFPNR